MSGHIYWCLPTCLCCVCACECGTAQSPIVLQLLPLTGPHSCTSQTRWGREKREKEKETGEKKEKHSRGWKRGARRRDLCRGGDVGHVCWPGLWPLGKVRAIHLSSPVGSCRLTRRHPHCTHRHPPFPPFSLTSPRAPSIRQQWTIKATVGSTGRWKNKHAAVLTHRLTFVEPECICVCVCSQSWPRQERALCYKRWHVQTEGWRGVKEGEKKKKKKKEAKRGVAKVKGWIKGGFLL